MTYTPTTYPTTLDTPVIPLATDLVAVIDHAGLEGFQNNAIVALETKVGVTGSAVTTSVDYKLSTIPAADKAVSKTGTETLTNKTLTAPILGTPASVNLANATNLPDASVTMADVVTGNVSTTAHGFAPKNPNDSSKYLDGTGAYSVPAGATSYPELFSNDPAISVLQPFLHSFSDANNGLCRISGSGTTISFHSSLITGGYQTRATTSDWASANSISSSCVVGAYLYVMLYQTTTAYQVYRYSKTNLAAGGTLMTFSGQSLTYNNGSQVMTSDGTNFYFNNKSGGSANSYVVSKFTLSGTTFTYVSDITCGSTASDVSMFVQVDGSTNIYGYNTSNRVIKKFNSSGTLQTTYGALPTQTGNAITFYCFGSISYTQTSFDDAYITSGRHYYMNRFYL